MTYVHTFSDYALSINVPCPYIEFAMYMYYLHLVQLYGSVAMYSMLCILLFSTTKVFTSKSTILLLARSALLPDNAMTMLGLA